MSPTGIKKCSCPLKITFYDLDIFYDSEAMVLSVGTEVQIKYNKRKNITKQYSPQDSSIVWFL